jgi:DNA replication protein DnaC
MTFDTSAKAESTQWPLFRGRALRANLPTLHVDRFITLPHDDAAYKNAPWGKLEAWLGARLGTGMIITLDGIRGTGKTQVAVNLACWDIIVRIRGDDRRQPLYFKARELFAFIKGTYRKESSRTETEAVAAIVSASLLIIDEIQERGETAYEDQILTHIIDKRYDARRDTLILSNLTRGELLTALGPSIVSRISECGKSITCTWPSFRGGGK